jgi:hypothetical protein
LYYNVHLSQAEARERLLQCYVGVDASVLKKRHDESIPNGILGREHAFRKPLGEKLDEPIEYGCVRVYEHDRRVQGGRA